MGGVELLSREGEIAIAKRIEAGKDVMISALLQSPITAKKIFEWKEKLEKNELLVREIIDIDSTYGDFEAETESVLAVKSKANLDKSKNDKLKKLDKNSNENKTDETKEEETKEEGKKEEFSEEDEFNPSLAAMEAEIRPQVILTIDNICKNYNKILKETSYKNIQNEIISKVKTLQLSSSVLEELVQDHYQESKKITSLEGNLLRLAEESNISRDSFIKYYVGNEINPNFQSFLKENTKWKNFFQKKKKEFKEIRERLVEFS